MKHYVNFGTAKTATTWLFENIIQSTAIDYNKEKEPSLDLLNNTNDYVKYYARYNFALNFNTNTWKLDSNQIEELNKISTHNSIIFRNPYQYINSLYNFWNSTDLSSEIFLTSFTDRYLNYSGILKRLPKNIFILYYDDIVSDPQKILDSLSYFLEIPQIPVLNEKINVTTYKSNLRFTDKDIKHINKLIENFEDTCGKDCSHWKLNA
jgi:hypothetical protein